MVRRSTVDRSPQQAMHSGDYDAGTGDLAQNGGGTRHNAGPGWRGAGGRWLVWLFRIVVWIVLLVIGYRGVMAIILNETPPSKHPAASSPAPQFPATQASAYAWQFGQVYLNASPATASQRASELAPFLPHGADPQLGWDGSGTLQLQAEQVASIDVRDAHHAVVLLLCRVNGNLMELGVPIYAASDGSMVLSSEPAWLPAPKRASPPSPAPVSSDQATQNDLMSQLPAFFQAYAGGKQDTLDRYLYPGARVTGLGGAVTFGSLAAVKAPPGGTERDIVATVIWRIPGQPATGSRVANNPPTAGLEMTYALTIVKQHGTWYVKSISPAAQVTGVP
jgi:Conjugative transposon protein TcpC